MKDIKNSVEMEFSVVRGTKNGNNTNESVVNVIKQQQNNNTNNESKESE